MKSIRLALAVAALAITTPLLAAGRFESLVNGYKNLQPGDATQVSGVTFTIGHMKITLESGKAAPLMVAGEQAGIFFVGQGSFQYVSADKVEIPILTYNTKKEAKLDASIKGTEAVLSDKFTEILLLGAGVELPKLTGGGAGSIAEELKKNVEYFERDRGVPQEHQLALQKLAYPTSKVVRAQIRGGGDNLLYIYDGAETTEESLVTLKNIGIQDRTVGSWLRSSTLSALPIDRDRKTPPKAPYLLTDLDYTLVADGENAKMMATETIYRPAHATALRFTLNDISLPRLGVAPRRYKVNSVKDATGRSLPFDFTDTSLFVSVEGIQGETIKLTFDIEGDYLIRPNGDAFWQLGVEPWFPQPDLNGQYYTVHSVVKVKKPWIAFAPGKTIRRVTEGDYNVVENRLSEPVQFAVVHAGKYEYSEETRGGLTVRVAAYAGKNERAEKQLTNLTYQLVEYYQFFLGPFPFEEFNIIQINDWGYGVAPPGTMFVTNSVFQPTMGDLNRIFSTGSNELFAHEIAHQYWAHSLKMPSLEEQWLTESFAEYSAALALRKYQGEGVYKRMVARWKQSAKDAGNIAPIALANRIAGDPQDAFMRRTGLLYNKGPYVLYAMHKEMGDDQFLTLLKSYQKSRRFKFGNTADFANLAQFLTKKDYQPFFDKYFWGTEMPQ
ncbi:MAG TPA: M1 family aminopeptidase [Thermoanaerobaculia bacterium]